MHKDQTRAVIGSVISGALDTGSIFGDSFKIGAGTIANLLRHGELPL
jgi:hypothetical protein